ncbi:MAG: hypothetical protein IJD20_05250 [Oscillospiraceae bacterium]|nr:hypothetical protein [Oscillospiraceae bacterium]MBR2080966.1 hypothetical protein [Oscillospiraceae bacterium]MBR2366531.1 hypothetical protein [Oscillospiraceae bacterium]MBR2977644.1 hypothetical protein [Oscillospiraceae bacterium]MBR3850361.1 hypothetical protein [Oscillospiraceae bacterium]
MDKTQVGLWRPIAEVLRLSAEENVVRWKPIRRIRMYAERLPRPALFSANGLSSEGWRFTIRALDLRITDAIRWNGRHYFLTSIVQTPARPGFLTVEAAKVKLVDCVAAKETTCPGPAFQAVLTEKYIRHEQHSPDAVNLICYVLVTPKCVALAPGSLVEIDGAPYEVLVAHKLDEAKNEYECLRKADL